MISLPWERGLLISFLLLIQESITYFECLLFLGGFKLQKGGTKSEALRQRLIPTLRHKPSLLTHADTERRGGLFGVLYCSQ